MTEDKSCLPNGDIIRVVDYVCCSECGEGRSCKCVVGSPMRFGVKEVRFPFPVKQVHIETKSV